MRIFLLGATGRTGKLVMQQALQRDHIVHALVRDKSKVKLSHANLILFEGQPADKAALENAMKGCEAILSALNISRDQRFSLGEAAVTKRFFIIGNEAYH